MSAAPNPKAGMAAATAGEEAPEWAKTLGPASPTYRNTAAGVLAEEGASERVAGKVVLVTGGSSGIGVATVQALVGAGALVYVAVRDVAKGREALGADICAAEGTSVATKGKVVLMALDLADEASVRAFAREWLALDLPLNILLLNAGIMALPEHTLSQHGNEMMLQVNFVSNFLLANLLAPALVRAAAGAAAGAAGADDGTSRMVVVSSCAHLAGDVDTEAPNGKTGDDYDKRLAYGASKSAASHFAAEFDRRFQERGVRAFSLHPGGIRTGLQKHMSQAEMQKLGWIDADGKVNPLFKSVEEGASTSCWAISSPALNGKGGLYLEDCQISIPSPVYPVGFAPWLNGDDASRAQSAKVWELGNRLLKESF